MIGINFPEFLQGLFFFFFFLHFNGLVCDQFQVQVNCKWKISESNWVVLDILGSQLRSSSQKGQVQLCCTEKCQGQLNSNWKWKEKWYSSPNQPPGLCRIFVLLCEGKWKTVHWCGNILPGSTRLWVIYGRCSYRSIDAMPSAHFLSLICLKSRILSLKKTINPC